jgi:hypothetical protein
MNSMFFVATMSLFSIVGITVSQVAILGYV